MVICLVFHPTYTNFGTTFHTIAITNEGERTALQDLYAMHPTRQGLVLHVCIPTQPGVELCGDK